MIDTDKYEWDSKCRMVVIDGELYQRDNNGDYHLSLYDKAVAQIIADTPLLLAEVKRLRKGIKEAIHHLTYPAKYDKEVAEQTDKLKELIG
jgi:hypothetical protein